MSHNHFRHQRLLSFFKYHYNYVSYYYYHYYDHHQYYYYYYYYTYYHYHYSNVLIDSHDIGLRISPAALHQLRPQVSTCIKTAWHFSEGAEQRGVATWELRSWRPDRDEHVHDI